LLRRPPWTALALSKACQSSCFVDDMFRSISSDCEISRRRHGVLTPNLLRALRENLKISCQILTTTLTTQRWIIRGPTLSSHEPAVNPSPVLIGWHSTT